MELFNPKLMDKIEFLSLIYSLLVERTNELNRQTKVHAGMIPRNPNVGFNTFEPTEQEERQYQEAYEIWYATDTALTARKNELLETWNSMKVKFGENDCLVAQDHSNGKIGQLPYVET